MRETLSEKGKTAGVTVAAMTAALYAVITLVFAPISCGAVQIRISEALTVLPGFFVSAVPGLTAGCFIANLLIGSSPADVIFGSAATFLAAVLTARLKNHPRLLFVPPVIINALVIPFVLKYAAGSDELIPVMMLSVGTGELLSAGIMGNVLRVALTGILNKRKKAS